MNNIKELDPVALTCDLPERGLKRGDVSTAILVHGADVAFEVEFVGCDGHTVALLTLERRRCIHFGPEIFRTPANALRRSPAQAAWQFSDI
jgi:hypothetical protein